MSARLPVHGFVLAGGKSSRMGQDKALLQFRGRPMVEIAVEKLRSFCAAVSIVGEREDLEGFAPVVRGEREGAGPAAGIEAGLRASTQDWAMYLPVDVPLLSAELLRVWGAAVLARESGGVRLSFLRAAGEPHPAVCMIHRDCTEPVHEAVSCGILKLIRLFAETETRLGEGSLWPVDAEALLPAGDVELWFRNVNTPQDLAEAERDCGGRAARADEILKSTL